MGTHLGYSDPTSAMLTSPVSADIFLFIAAAVASGAESAAAVTTDVACGGEVAPLTVAAFEAPAAAAGNAGRPLAAAAAGNVAGPGSPTPNGLEFPGMERVESGFFSCGNQRHH